ncbi:MAG: beta-propeller domain-containing protein, partial [bacterium]|nr:beta-propeller domain-containing protein [bacterium]
MDEPEILKTDGKYFYYYNQETNKISILSSPLDIQKAKLYPEKLALVKEIAVPQDLSQVELFLAEDRLVLMGTLYARTSSFQSRFTWLRSDLRTVIAVYDTSNLDQLKLLSFQNLPGAYQDARLIEDQLYVIAEQGINRWNWKGQKHDFRNAFARVEINAQGQKSYPLECDQIAYVLPEDKNLSLDPMFTLVFAMDIRDASKKAETTALLAPNGELHMSKNALYLVSNFYTYENWACPRGLLCALPFFRNSNQTLIHKFERKGLELNYQNTAIVPGAMLTQYSMDEDAQGYFRILTKTWEPKLATHLYILNPDLTFAGKLENIEPGEEFKSSRYMGDKLYLVTFEQIDPLFVVDLANPQQPKIIGELKIPGYSTYLHP